MAINSDAKALKMQEKEQKLLAYFKRQKAKPKPKLYLIYMIFILALIYIVDEVATNLPNSLETELNIFYVGMPLVNSGAFTLDQLLAVGYNGIVEPAEIKFDKDAAKKWISNGAQPTDTVRALFRKTGLLEEIHKEKTSK